ncbi:MAG: hypothetical protein ACLGG1_05875 [Gammaproteobacteria bacterium]
MRVDYAIEPGTALANELNRILRRQIAIAMDALATVSRKRLQGVPEALAALERMAAIGHLLAATDPDLAGRAVAQVEAISDSLAPLREYIAQRALFAELFGGLDTCTVFEQVREISVAPPVLVIEGRELSPKRLAAAVSRRLELLVAALHPGLLGTFDPADIRAGLAGSRADCRRHAFQALKSGEGADFRHWARYARFYSCQLELLGVAEKLDPLRTAQAVQLADLLSHEPELATLHERLRYLVRSRTEVAYQPFIDAIADRRQILRLEIETLAELLLDFGAGDAQGEAGFSPATLPQA